MDERYLKMFYTSTYNRKPELFEKIDKIIGSLKYISSKSKYEEKETLYSPIVKEDNNDDSSVTADYSDKLLSMLLNREKVTNTMKINENWVNFSKLKIGFICSGRMYQPIDTVKNDKKFMKKLKKFIQFISVSIYNEDLDNADIIASEVAKYTIERICNNNIYSSKIESNAYDNIIKDYSKNFQSGLAPNSQQYGRIDFSLNFNLNEDQYYRLKLLYNKLSVTDNGILLSIVVADGYSLNSPSIDILSNEYSNNSEKPSPNKHLYNIMKNNEILDKDEVINNFTIFSEYLGIIENSYKNISNIDKTIIDLLLYKFSNVDEKVIDDDFHRISFSLDLWDESDYRTSIQNLMRTNILLLVLSMNKDLYKKHADSFIDQMLLSGKLSKRMVIQFIAELYENIENNTNLEYMITTFLSSNYEEKYTAILSNNFEDSSNYIHNLLVDRSSENILKIALSMMSNSKLDLDATNMGTNKNNVLKLINDIRNRLELKGKYSNYESLVEFNEYIRGNNALKKYFNIYNNTNNHIPKCIKKELIEYNDYGISEDNKLINISNKFKSYFDITKRPIIKVLKLLNDIEKYTIYLNYCNLINKNINNLIFRLDNQDNFCNEINYLFSSEVTSYDIDNISKIYCDIELDFPKKKYIKINNNSNVMSDILKSNEVIIPMLNYISRCVNFTEMDKYHYLLNQGMLSISNQANIFFKYPQIFKDNQAMNEMKVLFNKSSQTKIDTIFNDKEKLSIKIDSTFILGYVISLIKKSFPEKYNESKDSLAEKLMNVKYSDNKDSEIDFDVIDFDANEDESELYTERQLQLNIENLKDTEDMYKKLDSKINNFDLDRYALKRTAESRKIVADIISNLIISILLKNFQSDVEKYIMYIDSTIK